MSACKLHVVLVVWKQLAAIVIATPVKWHPLSGMMPHTSMVQYCNGVLAELGSLNSSPPPLVLQGLEIPYAKTKVLRFGTQRTNEDAEEPLYLPTMYHKDPDVENNLHDGGPASATNPVQSARKYAYLGVLMDDNARFTEHMKSKVTPAVKGARSRVYRYYATSCGLSPDGCALVLRTLVEPHLRYCAALWAPVELPAAQAVGQRNPLPWTVTKTATEELATA